MKKIILCLITLLFLTACSNNIDQDTFVTEIKNAVDDASQVELVSYTENNASKEYYSYNIFANTTKVDGTDTTNTFYIFNSKSVLNLDVAGIIANKYYLKNGENELILRAIDTLKDPVISYSSTFNNTKGEKRAYRLFVNELNDNYFYAFIQTNEFLLNSFVYKTDVSKVCYEMIKLLRSCNVDTQKVIDDFSSIRQQEYTVKALTIFQDVMPETGYVEDYLDSWRENPAFSLVD